MPCGFPGSRENDMGGGIGGQGPAEHFVILTRGSYTQL
jgi:hypothetical protein